MKQVSFPGFGIGPFTVNPDFITIGDFAIKWYAVIIVFGMISAGLYVFFRARKMGLLTDDLLDLFLLIVFPGVIGARLYYVLFHHNNIHSFWDVFNIRDGGLAIYGGIIVGAAMAFLGAKIKKMHIPAFCDLLAPAVMLAQAIGRWGNFMNVEAYGSETALPWRMGIQRLGEWIYVHPTFLYESLWNLLGFALIMIFYKKRKFDGQVVLTYLTWYGFGRMFIEGLRTDSLYLGSTNIRVSQLLSGILFVCALAALIFFMIRIKGTKLTQSLYHKDAKHYEKSLEAIAAYEKKVRDRQAKRETKQEEKRKEKEATRQDK